MPTFKKEKLIVEGHDCRDDGSVDVESGEIVESRDLDRGAFSGVCFTFST